MPKITDTPATFTNDEKFERKLALTRYYYQSPRDEDFPVLLNQMMENFKARTAGGGMKECALVIMGESNSGKTSMLERHISTFPAFQPRLDEDGRSYSPVLMVEAPGSCSTKSFAIAMLAAIGIHATSRASEFELYAILKRALKINRYECVVVDEMQHAVRGTKQATVAKVQDVFKSLLQIDDWPIQFIFSGTHELSSFLLGDRQLANRCMVMRLHPLDREEEDHLAFTKRLIEEIVVDAAKLRVGWIADDLLVQRLIQASRGAMGTAIKLAQQACCLSIDGDRSEVMISDFAEAYRLKSGCIMEDNIFLSDNWENLDPAFAVADLGVI